MIIVLRSQSAGEERQQVMALLQRALGGLRPISVTHMPERAVIAIGESALDPQAYSSLNTHRAVERLIPIATPYQLISRAFQPEDSQVAVGGDLPGSQPVIVGASSPVVIAGPCSVESREQLLSTACSVKAAGAQVLRGGAFKPRTSPYQFQGLGIEGLKLLAEARAQTGLPVITEVMEPEMVDVVAEYADVLQIGSRNMQNFPLLRAVGRHRAGRPVMLKRGMAATIEEWLLAAEYVVSEGNPHVILCERGIRSFDSQTRNVLDLACVPLLHELTYLPVLIDPSHATGRRELVPAMSRAAIAAGAAGLMLEVHPNPERALSDGRQSITPEQLAGIVREVRLLAQVMNGQEAFFCAA